MEKVTRKQRPRGHVGEVDKLIGLKLLELRTISRMTQREIGAMLDVTIQQVQKYEQGKNRIPYSKILLLCDHFNISLEYFSQEPLVLLKQGYIKQDHYLKELEFIDKNKTDIARLIKVFLNVSDKTNRENIIDFIKKFKG